MLTTATNKVGAGVWAATIALNIHCSWSICLCKLTADWLCCFFAPQSNLSSLLPNVFKKVLWAAESFLIDFFMVWPVHVHLIRHLSAFKRLQHHHKILMFLSFNYGIDKHLLQCVHSPQSSSGQEHWDAGSLAYLQQQQAGVIIQRQHIYRCSFVTWSWGFLSDACLLEATHLSTWWHSSMFSCSQIHVHQLFGTGIEERELRV